MPRVTVIIPNYNHAPYLEKRIESVLSQTFQDFELILLDDFSTDNSRQMLEHYRSHPKVTKMLFNGTNSGSTFKQWNKGVRQATGKYIWLAESDDYADLQFLEKMVHLLEAFPSATLGFCSSHLINEQGEVTGNTTDWEMAHEPWQTLASQQLMSGTSFCRYFMTARCALPNASGVVFSRSAFEKAGGADEQLQMTGDWKLWFNLALLGDVVFLPESLNYFRAHAQTVRTQKAHVLKKEALRNLKQFYHQLDDRHAADQQLLTHIFEWAFREAIWLGKRKYSNENLKAYFKGASWPMVSYFLRNHLGEVAWAKGQYWYRKLF